MRVNQTGRNTDNLQVSFQPNIGVDLDARKSIVETLNIILADEVVLTMKTRSAYWHVHGSSFHSLRILLYQQLNQLNSILDEIAERVRMLGAIAISSFVEFLHYTRLEEQPGIKPDLIDLLVDHEAFVRFLREDVQKCLELLEDQGTYALIVRIICLHEKIAWILRSHIEPGMTPTNIQENKVPDMSKQSTKIPK